MRRLSGSIRAGMPQVSRGANRQIRPIISKSAGAGLVIVLSILFWSIFYQNMPNNLDGMASTGPVVTENPVNRAIKLCIIAMSVFAIVSRWSLTRALAKEINIGAVVFLLLVPLSTLWSIEPAATMLRFVTLASIVLLCYANSLVGWNRRRFQQLAIPPMMFILIGSLVVGILYPDRITELGTDISQKGAWHGITHSKNEFGMMASLATIICVNRWLAREGGTFWAMAGAAVGFMCLVLSRSSASLLATTIAVVSMVLLMRVPIVKRRYSVHVVIGIAAAIVVTELAIQRVLPGIGVIMGPISSLTGKDSTFSARTTIWNVIKDHIQAAPYLGTGYGAYWIGPFPQSPSYVFLALMYFYPIEAHNGYLDVLNDLGIVGLMCLLLFVIWFIRQGLQLMQVDRSQAALYLALLFMEMVINMSESDWFSRSDCAAIFMLAIVCLSRSLHESRLAPQPVSMTHR